MGIVYRNYDEEKRGFKGHDRNEEQEETVESQVQGMAADIVQNDAERRGQELVGLSLSLF